MEVTSNVSGEDVGRRCLGVLLLGCLWGKEWEAVMSRESRSYTPHVPVDTPFPFPGPLRQVPPRSPAPSSVPREERRVRGEMASASLLLLIKLGQSKEGGLSQPPVVRVRAATSGLMSQQAFSQILSLFSFLLHEMGIINEKQRGAGRGSGGTELLACQTWAPTPKLEPYTIPALYS